MSGQLLNASLQQSLKKYISIQTNAQHYEALSKPQQFKGYKVLDLCQHLLRVTCQLRS